jgi:hypothetical protein
MILDCLHIQTRGIEDADLGFTCGFYFHLEQVSHLFNFVAKHLQRGRFFQPGLAEATDLSETQPAVRAKCATAMGLLASVRHRLTDSGHLGNDYDSHFEDVGTTWVCHHALSAEPKRVLWNHATNYLLPTGQSYPPPDVRKTQSQLTEAYSSRMPLRKVLQEACLIFDAYTEQALRRFTACVSRLMACKP